MFFSTTPNVFSPQPFSIKFQFRCWRRRPSLSPQGEYSSLPLSLAQKCHREAGSGEFVCCFYSPPLPIFSHGSLFQLICYSVGRARRPPSVDKVNNSPPHPSPTCKSRGEGSVGELIPPLHFSPHHFQCFLTAAFFNFIAVPLAVSAAFPQFRRQIRARRRYPPNTSCFEKAVTVSFCHILFSPTIPFFHTASLFI